MGDTFLGRLGALRLVMALQIVTSLGSSLINVENGDFYMVLSIWRFVLGISAGAVYPLAAVLSAESVQGEANGESSDDSHHHDPVHSVVLTFSTQGLGFVTVPIVAVILFHLTDKLNVIWRLLLGSGSLPGILLMILQFRLYTTGQQPASISSTTIGDENQDGEQVQDEEERAETNDELVPHQEHAEPETDTDTHQNSTWCTSLLHEPGLVKKVLGTAGTWFFFDVIFYGNTIFQPIVVEAAFGKSEAETPFHELSDTAWKSLILTSIALPGYFVAAVLIGKRVFCLIQTPRYVMMQGFAAMGILYTIIGKNWSYLRHYPALLLFLYGMTFFFANYGPNTTTFILPSLCFSPEHRTTWNGISAACGKLGALVGASLFKPAADSFGDNVVMLICACLSVVAYFLTFCFVPRIGLNQTANSI